jgi:hypothetical protein
VVCCRGEPDLQQPGDFRQPNASHDLEVPRMTRPLHAALSSALTFQNLSANTNERSKGCVAQADTESLSDDSDLPQRHMGGLFPLSDSLLRTNQDGDAQQ